MSSGIAHSRKSQLALLAGACERGVEVLLAPRREAHVVQAACLSSVERDGVLVRCEDEMTPEIGAPGAPVQANFDVDGRRYVFSATSRGCVPDAESRDGGRLLKLSLPVTIERARARQRVRVRLDESREFYGVFTHVFDANHSFRARLTNVSEGGLGVVAKASELSHMHTGDLFRVSLEAPGNPAFAELAVRLIHLRPAPRSDLLAMGWAFHPMDDATRFEECLSRLATLSASNREGD